MKYRQEKMGNQIDNLRNYLDPHVRKAFYPISQGLVRVRLAPNQLTAAGAVLNLVAAGLLVTGRLVPAGIVFLLGSLLDMLDGTLARLRMMVTPFGAFLDSTLDRVSEGVMLAAIAYRFAEEGRDADVAIVVLALLGSVLVSYTRARAEALGVQCRVGLMSRPERVILIALGIFFNVLPYVIYVLVALTSVTVIQRTLYTYRKLRVLEGRHPEGGRGRGRAN